VERQQFHADRAASLGKAAAKLSSLSLIGQNNRDGREGITLSARRRSMVCCVLPEAAEAMRSCGVIGKIDPRIYTKGLIDSYEFVKVRG
jgi:hypothetical protein